MLSIRQHLCNKEKALKDTHMNLNKHGAKLFKEFPTLRLRKRNKESVSFPDVTGKTCPGKLLIHILY